MTLDELLARESIRKTLVGYNIAGDRLRVDEFAACFTDDAIFEIAAVGEDPGARLAGREVIREWFLSWGRGAKEEKPVHQATFIRHHLSTCHIDLTAADTAKTRTYWTAYTDIGPDHGGYYLDSFRKVGEQWLIAHRQVRHDWSSPNSLYVTSLTNLRKQQAAARRG
jgi:3-phenylpropionate/cinnamic acid dioxygenase small subunit